MGEIQFAKRYVLIILPSRDFFTVNKVPVMRLSGHFAGLRTIRV